MSFYRCLLAAWGLPLVATAVIAAPLRETCRQAVPVEEFVCVATKGDARWYEPINRQLTAETRSNPWEILRYAYRAERLGVSEAEGSYFYFFDWKSESEDFLHFMNKMIELHNLRPISGEAGKTLIERGQAAWGESVPIEAMAPVIANHIAKQGSELMYIDTGADSYAFTIMNAQQAARWHRVSLGEYFNVVRFDPEENVQAVLYDAQARLTAPRPYSEVPQ